MEKKETAKVETWWKKWGKGILWKKKIRKMGKGKLLTIKGIGKIKKYGIMKKGNNSRNFNHSENDLNI